MTIFKVFKLLLLQLILRGLYTEWQYGDRREARVGVVQTRISAWKLPIGFVRNAFLKTSIDELSSNSCLSCSLEMGINTHSGDGLFHKPYCEWVWTKTLTGFDVQNWWKSWTCSVQCGITKVFLIKLCQKLKRFNDLWGIIINLPFTTKTDQCMCCTVFLVSDRQNDIGNFFRYVIFIEGIPETGHTISWSFFHSSYCFCVLGDREVFCLGPQSMVVCIAAKAVETRPVLTILVLL